MSRSSLRDLDPRIREEVDAFIRADRGTIDDLVALIRGDGAEVSRSAAGRYVKRAREEFRAAQERAKLWMEAIRRNPDGDVAKMNIQLLATVAEQRLREYMDPAKAAEIDPEGLMLLAKALDHAARAERFIQDRDIKFKQQIEEQARREAADHAVAAAKKGGLSAAAADQIRREILGISA